MAYVNVTTWPNNWPNWFLVFSICSQFMPLSLICRVSISTPYYFLRLNLNLKNNWLFAANVIPNLSISLNFPNVGYDCFLSKPKSLSSWTFFISLWSWQYASCFAFFRKRWERFLSWRRCQLHHEFRLGRFCENVQRRTQPNTSVYGRKIKNQRRHDACYETWKAHGEDEIQALIFQRWHTLASLLL